jgi:hypothetical protein
MYKYACPKLDMSTQKNGDYTLDTEEIILYSGFRIERFKVLHKYTEARK